MGSHLYRESFVWVVIRTGNESSVRGIISSDVKSPYKVGRKRST